MVSSIDLLAQEKAAAKKATNAIRTAFRNAVKTTTTPGTGNAIKITGSRAVFKDQRLQRVTLKAPHYIFKQHHGFEGSKRNGVNMRLKATNVLNVALGNSNVLESLVDEISDIRGSQVLSKINFQ